MCWNCTTKVEMGIILICYKVVELASIGLCCKKWSWDYPNMFESGETIMRRWRWILSASVGRWWKWHHHLCTTNIEVGIIIICLKVVEPAWISMYFKSLSVYFLSSVWSWCNWHQYIGAAKLEACDILNLKWILSSSAWMWWNCTTNVEVGIILICSKVVETVSTYLYGKSLNVYYTQLEMGIIFPLLKVLWLASNTPIW